MKLSCNVIDDLLPLYLDEVCSTESAALVEEHLAACPACREKLAALRQEEQPEPMHLDEAEPLAKLAKSMKRKVLIRRVLLGALAALLLLCFVPLPERINLTRSGWLVSDTGEVLAEDVQLTLTGWRYHYLLRQDRAALTLTAQSESVAEANFTRELSASGTSVYGESELPGVGYTMISGSTYDGGANMMTNLNICYTEYFEEIMVELGTRQGCILAAEEAESPEDMTLPELAGGTAQ